MATLASLTVALGIDTSQVAAGARRAVAHIRSMGRDVDNAVADADGRLRNAQGQFVAQGSGLSAAFSRGFLPGMGATAKATSGILMKALGVVSVGAIGAAGALAAVPLAIVGIGVAAAAQA